MKFIMYRYGWCARRDSLYREYDRASQAAALGDAGALAWLDGWRAYPGGGAR